MRGLLQRLAGQALGTKPGGAPRIRPAMSVHAQAPVALPVDGEAPTPNLRPWPEQPGNEAISADRGAWVDSAARAPDETVSRAATMPNHSITDATEPIEVAHPRIARAPPRNSAREASLLATELAAPGRLLDEVAPAQLSPLAIVPMPVPPPPALGTTRAGASNEPTEVHVHIGRIEVTAVTESEKPKKPRSSAPRQTVPLADYLARRSRS